MEARISAVQQTLLLLLVASLALAVLARPHPENRQFTGALTELTQFRAGFQRQNWERSLREHAEAQGTLPLSAVQSALLGKGLPSVEIADAAPPVRPLTDVRLATLAEVHAHAGQQSTLTIGIPDVQALGAALSWRLAHEGKSARLKSVQLAAAAVSLDDVKLEQEVARLRIAVLDAEAEVTTATDKLTLEQNVFEARRKRGLPWKTILKSIEAVKLATETLDAKKASLLALQQRYQSEATRAQAQRASTTPGRVPTVAVATVTLEREGTESSYTIPVILTLRDVVVPALPQGAFAATRAAGLWDEVKGYDAEHAIAAVKAHFNWHNRGVQLLGLSLSGALLLHLLPCLLPALLAVLLIRMRAVGKNYSPFSTKVRGALPRVGFRSRAFDWIVLVVLPFLVVASAAASLLLIGQLPVLPGVTALACLALGAVAASRLSELQELITSVVQSHSYPPPE